ncbi:MAG: hypothetical protein ACXWPM_06865, partial [Bdellovibrionota bacterium]
MTLRWVALVSILIPSVAEAYTIYSGTMVEDFSDASHFDATTSTGVWNIVNKSAEAPHIANGTVINFGNGADGVLNSASGYTFDTDAHPNGYNFSSVNITGGTITIKGANTLIIRSLSTINITPPLSAKGGTGTNGASLQTTGPLGGVAIAGKCKGGTGGNATAASASAGGPGSDSNNSPDGSGGSAGAAPGSNGGSAATGPTTESTFETTTFVCGGGGGGGGGHFSGGHFATGSGGGAGGGLIKLISVGNITAGTLDASGGNGGISISDGSGSASGGGAGGNGGGLWAQTLGSISASMPNVIGGNDGNGGGAGFTGAFRADTLLGTSPSGWTQLGTWTFATNGFQPGTYVVTIASNTYDLGTSDPSFSAGSVVTTDQTNTSIVYSGSSDGSVFSPFTSDLTTLSDKNIRYLKFKLTLNVFAGASPQVSKITVPFTELNVRLAGGCGTTKRPSDPRSGLSWLMMLAFMTA